jgi:hypothetical protein
VIATVLESMCSRPEAGSSFEPPPGRRHRVAGTGQPKGKGDHPGDAEEILLFQAVVLEREPGAVALRSGSTNRPPRSLCRLGSADRRERSALLDLSGEPVRRLRHHAFAFEKAIRELVEGRERLLCSRVAVEVLAEEEGIRGLAD